MKGIYIYSTNEKDYESNGESKKVLSQIKAFEEAQVKMKLLDAILDLKVHKLLYRLPGFGVYSNSFINECLNEAKNTDFIYIRKNIFDKSYIKLLRKLRRENQKIKIFVEIPTYPYFQEWDRLIDRPFIWKEKKSIPKVKNENLVDYYMTLSDDDFIFGIKTIKLNNCINVGDISPKQMSHSFDEIHMIGVALLTSWHGFDRVIKGLYEYYKEDRVKKVFFHIVGEGTELNTLKSLTKKLNLEEYVKFEGKLQSNKLNHLYDISNIGIGSLAPYRKGLNETKSLKHREYCAKGIPFVKAGQDKTFDSYKYCLSTSNDETPIDINQIVDFVDEIDYTIAIKEMREYAEEKLNWKNYINTILSKVNETEEKD